jgi:hypothetical protein
MTVLRNMLIVIALATGTARAAGEDPVAYGLKLAKAAYAANRGFVSEESSMTMELVNAHGDVTKRKMHLQLLETSDDGDKSLSVFEWPPDVKGTKLLTWTHRKSDDDQWLYLPAIKRVKRISSNNKSGSFMGSEFAFEDLASPEVEKFTYKYIADEKLGDRAVFHIERYPTDKNSGYSRQVVWMDKEYEQPLKIEYYDRKNELLKLASFEGYAKSGKYWRWTTIKMDNVQTKKKSSITWENRALGKALPAESFNSARLEN